MPDPLYVVGRFPPPLDGQAIATARLADLLDIPPLAVSRVNVGAPEGEHLALTSSLKRGVHFLTVRKALREALVHDAAPVLWPSISPSPLGHRRDLWSVAPALRGHPTVGVVHRGDFASLFTRPLTARSGRRLIESLTGLVFLTDGLAERCAPFVPAEKRHVIPNTIDGSLIPSPDVLETSRIHRAERDGIRLLYLSGMILSKGYGAVLDALHVLRQRGHEAHATFAGRWPSDDAESAFRSRIRQLELATSVTLLGGVSDREEARELYLNADVFVLPTTYPVEAQPLTILEALASGTPVVVSAHAGIPEMISEGQEGRFASPSDATAIAEAIEAICAPGHWTVHSRAARTRFDTAFSPEIVQRQWLKLVRSLNVSV